MDAKYLEKFDWMARRLEELSIAVAQPDIIADLPRWQSLLRERAALEPAVSAYHDYQKLTGEIADARELSEDPELGETAREELKRLEAQVPPLEQALLLHLIPRDPDDDRNVILEVRAGAGGERGVARIGGGYGQKPCGALRLFPHFNQIHLKSFPARKCVPTSAPSIRS